MVSTGRPSDPYEEVITITSKSVDHRSHAYGTCATNGGQPRVRCSIGNLIVCTVVCLRWCQRETLMVELFGTLVTLLFQESALKQQHPLPLGLQTASN